MKVAEKRFRDYVKYDREIAIRKYELTLKQHDDDPNFWIKQKGIKTAEAEELLIKYETDRYIQNRIFWKNCVSETLKELDRQQRMIVEEYYFDNVYSYRDLAKKYLTNKNTIMKTCRHACDVLNKKLGEK